jgi:integrase/recombinase XerD
MSTLVQELDRYLTIRRSLGYDLGTTARVLRRFVAFAQGRKAKYVTTDLFLAWQGEFGEANQQTWSARLGMVRQFALWLSGINPRNEVPPKGLIPDRYRRARPYIYSERELHNLSDWRPRLRVRPQLFDIGFRIFTHNSLLCFLSHLLFLDL